MNTTSTGTTQHSAQLRTQLRESGYRATPARLSVLRLLKTEVRPLSIEAIARKLKKLTLDQATLYRILNDFKSSGIVKEIDLRHGHAHYELATISHHHHIVCTQCGKIEDFSKCDFEKVSKIILKTVSSFAKITDHPSELFGICKKCEK